MRGLSKTRTGVVVSNKMEKTVVVATVRIAKHSLYKKYIKKRVRYKAHDQANTCQVGDTVLLKECRPLSKDKRWKVVEIVKRAV
jgi:small subunit ribosomal protein S17